MTIPCHNCVLKNVDGNGTPGAFTVLAMNLMR